MQPATLKMQSAKSCKMQNLFTGAGRGVLFEVWIVNRQSSPAPDLGGYTLLHLTPPFRAPHHGTFSHIKHKNACCCSHEHATRDRTDILNRLRNINKKPCHQLRMKSAKGIRYHQQTWWRGLQLHKFVRKIWKKLFRKNDVLNEWSSHPRIDQISALEGRLERDLTQGLTSAEHQLMILEYITIEL